MTSKERAERLRRYWDKHAASYDRQMGFFDRHLFADTRPWICSQARGAVLEVAIGTGLNLPHYPRHIKLTGIEWSPPSRCVGIGRSTGGNPNTASAAPIPRPTAARTVCHT